MHTVSSVLYLQVMEEAIQRLEKRHKEYIILYDPSGVSEGGGGGGGRGGSTHLSNVFTQHR